MNNIYYIIQRIKSLRFSVSVFMLLNLGTSLYSQTLEDQCREKIQILQTLIQQAETKGINTLKEQLAIRTAEVFLDYATWDENHVSENESYFKMVTPYKNNALQMAQNLSDFERKDIIKLLDENIEFIQLLIAEELFRKDIPKIDWKGVVHEGNQLTFNKQPVFLEDYTWKPDEDRLNEFYGNLDGFFISPNHVLDENGNINSNIVSQLQSKADGTPGNIFIAHKSLPQWAIDKYGEEITRHKGEPFFLYDIDNPGAKDVISKLIKGTVPLMAGKNYTKLGYMLANEPRWLNYKDGTNKVWYQGTVSDYTIEKFKSFLKEKHQTIERLNEVWGTVFTGFDAVTFQIPIDISKMGTPQWYDYATFNDARVLEWFLFMKNEIVSCDPEAKVHLKIMPSFFTENLACSGIDLEALTEMSEILGNDIAAHYNNIHNEVEWDNRYAFGWRELYMGYDFFKSVSPDKIIFNSESHLLSGSHVRDLYMDPAFVRAVFWGAHTLGLNASQIWYWPRKEDGSIRLPVSNGYAGSNNQQPRVTNEIHATMMDLNSYAEEIIAMQRQRKPLRIFYSKTSAHQYAEYMDHIFELYEKLNFDGVSLGFVTENIINKQNNINWDVIMLCETPRVTNAEMDALQAYLNNGGTIITDSKSLVEDEYGGSISALTSGNGSIIHVNTIDDFYKEAIAHLKSKSLLPEVAIIETNEIGLKGCTWKCIKNNAGNNVVSIVNLGKSEASITIKLNGAQTGTSCTDLLKGIQISSKQKLEPYGVMFIEVKDGKDIDSGIFSKKSIDDDMGLLFPNPSSGNFNIKLNKPYHKLRLSVLDMHGKVVSDQDFCDVNFIEYEIHNVSEGSYVVRLNSDIEVQNFILIKN